LAEGLATYVEGVARAQFGNRDVAEWWPRIVIHADGAASTREEVWIKALAGTHYWGGALYCLQADVAIREQTANRVGLQTALRAILKKTEFRGVALICDKARSS